MNPDLLDMSELIDDANLSLYLASEAVDAAELSPAVSTVSPDRGVETGHSRPVVTHGEETLVIPTYVGPPQLPASDPPPRLDHTDTALIRKAMAGVTRLYPGAAGKILSQFLLDYHEFGYRVTPSALPAQLVVEVLAQLPKQP